MHAVVVGSDINAQTKFETQLRDFAVKNGIQDRVHFVNKTLAVAPYLAATDVLVQNSQVSNNCNNTSIFSCFPSSVVFRDANCMPFVYLQFCIIVCYFSSYSLCAYVRVRGINQLLVK